VTSRIASTIYAQASMLAIMQDSIKDSIHELVAQRDWRSPHVLKHYKSWYGALRKKLFVLYLNLALRITPFVLIKNDFPYDELLRDMNNAEQWLIFYRGDKPGIEYADNKLTILGHRATIHMLNIDDYLVWENSASLKSIRSISHLQLIVERST
jgi:hypothetical protein